MQFIIFLCRFQVWNRVGRCNLMKFHAFLCRCQVWNCIDRCNVSHVYAILKCETLSFDVIWNKIILLWVHALFRDPLRGGRGNFTEIKFNQIRGRLRTFSDFFAKILLFEGFSKFSLSCRRQYSSALRLIDLVVSSYVGSFRLWFAPFRSFVRSEAMPCYFFVPSSQR